MAAAERGGRAGLRESAARLASPAHGWYARRREREDLVLALDQGGQSSRAILYDAEGVELGRGRRAVGEARPGPGRVEQDPEELVASLRDAAAEALAAAGGRAVACCGLATQRSSVVCWDRSDGAPLSPVLSWQDVRAAARMEPLAAEREALHALTGLFPSPHYGASKLRWCLDELPEVRRAADEGRLAMGPLASFLAARLTSAPPRIDPANAGRTFLWSLATRDWDAGLLARFGLERAWLPECSPTTRGDFGALELDGRPVPLRALDGDQAAAPFAFGAPRDDVAFVNLGTGAFVQRLLRARPTGAPRHPASLALATDEGDWYALEGTVNGAGSALNVVERELELDGVEPLLDAWMEAEPDPPLYLNGVSGIGSPYWVPRFDSRFVGRGGARARVVAVAESIAFLLQVNLEALDAAGAPLRALIATGGLARSSRLCATIADLSGLVLRRPLEQEATARGVANVAAGRLAPRDAEGERFEPRPRPALAERYRRWRHELERALDEQRRREAELG